MGKAISDVLLTILTPRYTGLQSPADVYNATDNINGNILANGIMNGSGGTLAGSAAGVVADSWTLHQIAGTVTGSKTTKALDNGTTYPVQTITLVASSTAKLYQQLYSPASLTVGDTVYMEAEVSVTGATNLLECHIQLDDATVVSVIPKAGGGNFPATFVGTLQTAPFVLTSKATFTGFFQCKTDAGGSAVVNVSKVSVRKA